MYLRKTKKDGKLKPTIIEILKGQLTNQCNSLVFICDNSDGRAECRELLFDRWYDEEADDKIEKFVKTYCEDEDATSCLNIYFIADKNCHNFEANVKDFTCDHI